MTQDRVGAPLLPGYEIVRPLGRGGMGTVYLARQVRLDREVALKVLPPAAALSPQARQRFLSEARALARVRHPHVVQVHDVLEGTEASAFAMELIRGASLAELLAAAGGAGAGQRLDAVRQALAAGAPSEPVVSLGHDGSWVGFVVRVGCEIADALAAVHAQGLVHRDVKPANILVRADGRALLSDFGLVRDAEATALTGTGQFMGTLAYAAPEQLRGAHDERPRVDARTDVYALGVTLYHALSLQMPFADDHPSAMAARIATGAVRPLRAVDPGLPRQLALVVAKAMDPDPARRYATAAALAADLRNVLELRPVDARPPGVLVRVRRWHARHAALAAALLAGAGTVLVGATAMLVTLDRRAQRARLATDCLLIAGLLDEVPQLVAGGGARTAGIRRWVHQARAIQERWASVPRTGGDAVFEETIDDARLARARAVLDGPDGVGNAAFFLQWVYAMEAGRRDRHDRGQAARVAGAGAAAVLKAMPHDLAALARAERMLAARVAMAEEAERLWQAALASSWPRACRDAADPAVCPAYHGLRLVPQDGLVPLGRDPQSGLLEFAHLQTGTPAQRDPVTGQLVREEGSGIVLILLPGGATRVGSLSPAEGETDGIDYRDASIPGPPQVLHDVRLDPFFVARHEMTQDQWLRVTGRNPSWFAIGAEVGGRIVNGRHPVESILREEAEQVLERLGLELPTHAQWECAARGGTTTRYWTGPGMGSLQGAANICDAGSPMSPAGMLFSFQREAVSWDDGWPRHAPAGSLRANPFGLHDVLGNVQEWCRELAPLVRTNAAWPAPRAGDGQYATATLGAYQPLARGGSWDLGPGNARIAMVCAYPPAFRVPGVGVRPARPLRP